ncbi:ATP-binding protein [Candidatus Omnitrophota bacterium]
MIHIDENKCNGCGVCIPNCPEGALQIIDGKARLVSDLFCDGLGACIGHCPEGAIFTEERDAQAYDERRVMKNIIKQGKNVIKAHLKHLKEHKQEDLLKQANEVLREKKIQISFDDKEQHSASNHGKGCPGLKVMDLRQDKEHAPVTEKAHPSPSQLRQWPVQLHLVPPFAPYLKDADLLIAADCVPFSYPDFHNDLLKGKVLLVGCPKLDDLEAYSQKITQIVKDNTIKSITYAHMEVPCCFGLVGVITSAIAGSGKDIPFIEVTISIKGERLK